MALDFEDFEGDNEKNPDVPAAAKPEAEADAAAKPDAAVSEEPEAAAVANTLDYGGVPNAVDPATAPAATGEEAKAPAPEKKPAAGGPTKPGYSIILDEDVTTVGICNKAHKKTINIIQVLYCKANKGTVNAMM